MNASGDRALAAVTVTIGSAAAGLRRALGPAAWCALEVVATTPSDGDDDPWTVRSSVRSIASRMGVATNTAQRALAVLRDEGLIASAQGRGDAGRFGNSAYRLTIDADVMSRPRAPRPASSRTSRRRRVGPKPPAAVKAVESGEQLVLLPSV
jgi:hypothetical protein